ncbi:MAG TPA: hypothetical protein VNW97_05020 [Candidatus Saccharimonadales bacterium]|nr:hypothetical protein [Candidatus Saccharimonadales bacterium]
MSRRTAICVLAAVVSLVATQPVSGRTQRTSPSTPGESTAIVWAAKARARKTVECETCLQPAYFLKQKPHTETGLQASSQVFYGRLLPRAPPLSLAS